MGQLISAWFPDVMTISVSGCVRWLWTFIVCNWSVTPGVGTVQTTCCICAWTYSKFTTSLTFLVYLFHLSFCHVLFIMLSFSTRCQNYLLKNNDRPTISNYRCTCQESLAQKNSTSWLLCPKQWNVAKSCWFALNYNGKYLEGVLKLK